MSVIVIDFITLDGIVSDPGGSAGTPLGGVPERARALASEGAGG
ncbi:hypothetical protein [Streptomyces sp. 6N223]